MKITYLGHAAILIQGSKSKKSRKSGQARKSEIGTGTISTTPHILEIGTGTISTTPHILSVNRACPDFPVPISAKIRNQKKRKMRAGKTLAEAGRIHSPRD